MLALEGYDYDWRVIAGITFSNMVCDMVSILGFWLVLWLCVQLFLVLELRFSVVVNIRVWF